jgi:hypothetical protein
MPADNVFLLRAEFIIYDEPVAEVLGLAGHLPIFELHDAHRVRRLPVVSKDEFSDPEGR